MQKPKNEPQLDAQEMLMYGLDFTEHDLEVNRDGYMSKRQRERLRRKSRKLIRSRYVNPTAVIWFVFIVSSFAFLVGKTEANTAALCIGGIAVVAIALLPDFIMLVSRVYLNVRADLNKGDVSVISGPVHLDTETKQQRKIAYSLKVADLTFPLTKEEFYSFKQGDAYTIYYAPHTKIILSAEPH